MKESETVFIDFLGYGDFCNYLVCKEPNKGIWSTGDIIKLKEKIKEEKWEVVPNPRFKDFPNHLKMVAELNE